MVEIQYHKKNFVRSLSWQLRLGCHVINSVQRIQFHLPLFKCVIKQCCQIPRLYTACNGWMNRHEALVG